MYIDVHMDEIDQHDCVIASVPTVLFRWTLLMCIQPQLNVLRWSHRRHTDRFLFVFLRFRLNYAAVLLVLILTVLIETSNAQLRVSTRARVHVDGSSLMMQSAERAPSGDNKQATTVNKQFSRIFYLHEFVKRRVMYTCSSQLNGDGGDGVTCRVIIDPNYFVILDYRGARERRGCKCRAMMSAGESNVRDDGGHLHG